MAITIIMAFTILTMWGALGFTYGKTSIENGKYLLGITLPKQYRSEQEVLEIVASYRQDNRFIHWGGFGTGAVLLLLSDYISIQFPLLMVWYGVLIFKYQENVKKHAVSLYELKKKNGWLAGNPHIVRVDTVLSSMKDRRCVSAVWFVPAWVLGIAGLFLDSGISGIWSIFLVVFDWRWMQCSVFLCTQVVFLLVWYCICHAKPQVYCSDTELNQKIARSVKFEWSRCMVLYAYVMAAFIWFVSWNQRPGNAMVSMTFGTVATAISSLVVLYITWYNTRKCKDRAMNIAAAKEVQIYGDDDAYWLYGYPAGRAPKGLTEKRIGVGWTTSASLQASTADYMICGFLGAAAIGIMLFFIPFDFAKLDMRIYKEERKCWINAKFMDNRITGCSFELDDVEEVVWFEERPSMSKKNGLDSNRFYFGDFRVSGYGNCRVYLSVKNDTAVYVNLKEGKDIWFNAENAAVARMRYEELAEALAE